jgi:hypothetical protein
MKSRPVLLREEYRMSCGDISLPLLLELDDDDDDAMSVLIVSGSDNGSLGGILRR